MAALDAFLTTLGPARVRPWMCDGPGALAEARAAARRFVEEVEARLSEQLDRSILLTPPLIPGRTEDGAWGPVPSEGDSPEEPPSLQVGGDDGLAPLQAAVLASALGEPYDAAASRDDPEALRQRAVSRGFDGPLGRYRHLLDHDPRTGLYLPIDFPRPLEARDRADLVSIGSLQRLRSELETWRNEVAPALEQAGNEVSDLVVKYAANLAAIATHALDQGLAVELA